MRSRSRLLLALLLVLIAGVLSAACGGSGDDQGTSDVSAIVTATPPDPLPEPLIVGETIPVVEGTTYIVQAGDTLAAIADQFAITAQAIAQANDIADPRRLEVGQELIIPGGAEGGEVLGATAEPVATAEPSPTPEPVATAEPSPTPEPVATAGPSPTPRSGEECIYTVQSGDVAYRLAEDHGISVEELAALNDTTVEDLRSLSIGDELVVPC